MIAPEPSDPVRALLARWGLATGRTVQGLVVAHVCRDASGGAADLTFRRGDDEIVVRLQRASSARHLTRVGEIDVLATRVDAGLARELGGLVHLIGAWLSRHGAGAQLMALLTEREGHAAPTRDAGGPAGAPQAYESAGEPPLDPAKRAPDDRPFVRFDVIDVSEIERYADALRQMYAGTFGGLVIRNVYAAEDMERITALLEGGDVRYPRTSFPARFLAHFYGRCLDGSDPQLGEYLRDAERFREETLSVFAGATPFEQRMEEVFGALAGGRRALLPRFPDGRAYTPATIRILLEGGQIGTHCGNEASTRPAYTHLNTLVDLGDQLSYFLTLQHAEGGGELIVYSLRWTDIDRTRIVGGRTQVDDLLQDAQWMAVAPRAGDLLIFDGGRYFHRVSKVEGSRRRFTIGGFLMFGVPGDALYYWS